MHCHDFYLFLFVAKKAKKIWIIFGGCKMIKILLKKKWELTPS